MLPNAQPRPCPKLLDKRQRASDLAKRDREERAKCRERSGGQCEVTTFTFSPKYRVPWRCPKTATENHHLIGGIGRKNKGKSLLAAHRLDVCAQCHREITGHVLIPCVPQDQAECAATVRYERRTK